MPQPSIGDGGIVFPVVRSPVCPLTLWLYAGYNVGPKHWVGPALSPGRPKCFLTFLPTTS